MKITLILSLLLLMPDHIKAVQNYEHSINEEIYLEVNDSEQYLMLASADSSLPLLLFVHGGPGASETAMLRKYNSALEEHFLVVYWDQRNAGKSKLDKDKIKDISLDQMLKDLDAVCSYLRNRFNNRKIALVGHSWGSRLGIYAAARRPENFSAYIGVAQEVHALRAEQITYKHAIEEATKQQNKKALKQLEKMGPPRSGNYKEMYPNGIKDFDKTKTLLLKLGGNVYDKNVYVDWMMTTLFSSQYGLFDAFRFVEQYKSTCEAMIEDPAYNNFDLFEQLKELKIPVYFISGSADYVNPWNLSQEYFNCLNAPSKSFYLFDRSGHNPMFEEAERFNATVVAILSELMEEIPQVSESAFYPF